MMLVRPVGAIWHLQLLIKIVVLAEPPPTKFNRNNYTIQEPCLVFSSRMEERIATKVIKQMKASTKALRHIERRPYFTNIR